MSKSRQDRSGQAGSRQAGSGQTGARQAGSGQERAGQEGPRTPDGRSPTARAAEWASRIITISLEMVLPGLAGYWVDLQLGTKVVFMLVGFAVGMFVAMKHLLHSIKKAEAKKPDRAKDSHRR